MSVYFELFGIKLPAYGTMAFLGLLVSVATAFYYARLYSIHMIDVVNCICYGGLGLITGAKLFYALPFLPEIYEMIKSDGISDFISYLPQILPEIFAGYVFYGGFIGIVAGIAFYTHFRRLPFWNFMNVLAIITPLFHGFGRIGCFFAGCCYGREYHGLFAVTFPQNSYNPELALTERFPVQLMESVCCFILFAILAFYGRKPRESGKLMGIYLIAYPVIRFITELFRGDDIRGMIDFGYFQISTSQIISLLLFPFGILLYYRTKNK